MEKIEIIASSTMGLESIIRDECKDLGFNDIKTFNGKVEFTGSFSDIVKANINLRCADRVFLKMGEFKATTFEELFQNIKKLPWNDIIPINGIFPVSWVSSVKSKLFSKSDIQKISKKAIVENMKLKYNQEFFSEDGALYAIKIQALNDIFVVMIDTTGEALNRRGYRATQITAPIKETLAAALIKIARWNGGRRPFLDPMCGTGTIAIEAAMIARNIAPGVNRNFVSENWDIIPSNFWVDQRDEAFSKEDYDKEVKIYASDIDEETIEIARNNIIKAGLEDDIILECKDFKDIELSEEAGSMITNPPYGERLLEADEVDDLYRDFGKFCKKALPTWSYYIISSYEEFEKAFGKKSTKNRKLYNGGIKCYFYQYYGDVKKNVKK